LRRSCFDGRKVHVDNRYRPEVSGERTIIHASTVGLTLTPPAGTTTATLRTNLDWPKAADTSISPDDLTCTIRFAAKDARRTGQVEATGSDIFVILTPS
jgi:hypothetical protein